MSLFVDFVAALLKTSKSRLSQEYPDHPLVVDVASKAEQFDELSSRFEVPSLPVVKV